MRTSRLIALTTSVLLVTTVAGADPITIVSSARFVLADATVSDAARRDHHFSDQREGDVMKVTTAASTGTSSATAAATLTSSISDPMHWFGAESVQASWTTRDQADMRADATVFVSFDVTSPVTYRATSFSESSFGTTAELPVGFSQAGSSFSLYSRTPAPGEDSEHGAVIFAGRGSFEGLLAPDRYFFNTGPIGYGAIHQGGGSGFFAAASGFFAAEAGFTLDFAPASPAPTPEPASLFLLGSSIVGLFAFGRSRTMMR